MTSKAYFKALLVLHAALTIGQVLFGGILFLVHQAGPVYTGRNGKVTVTYTQGPNGDLYFYIALGFVLAAALASYSVYRAKVAQARQKVALPEILADYRTAVILRDACLQGPSILAAIGYLITGNIRYLALTGLIVLIFATWWPSREKVIEALGLDGEYRGRLEDPEALV